MSDRLRLEDLPPYYRAQAEAQMAIEDARTCKPALQVANYSPKPKKPKRTDGYKSQLEADYAKHLDILVAAGEIIRWKYEPIRLRLAERTHYSPDFMIQTKSGLEFHETKGWGHDDAIAKYKFAREVYPEFGWRFVKKIKGRWEVREMPFTKPAKPAP